MPAPQRRFALAFGVGSAIPDGTETVVASTPPVSTSFPGCCFLIEFDVSYQLGAAATGLQFFIRQTGIAGLTAVPAWIVGPIDTVGLNGNLAASAVDQRAQDAAGIVWVLTATPAADTVTILGGTASVTIDVGGAPSIFSD